MLIAEKKEQYTNFTQELPDDLSKHLNSDSLLHEVLIGAMRAEQSSPAEHAAFPVQNILRRRSPLPGIETYCYVSWASTNNADARFTIRLTSELLAHIGLTETEVWIAAEKNTYNDNEFTVDSMNTLISDLIMGSSEGRAPECCNNPDMCGIPEPFSGIPMYVVSNSNKIRGAVQIFNRKALNRWAADQGYNRLIVIPSSIHEMIVIPADESNMSLDELNSMVREINAQEVSPREQLSDRVYLMTAGS